MDSASKAMRPMHNLRLVGPAGKRPTKKDEWLYPTFFWNQRKQRTGLVVTPSGKRFRLEDPADESSRRIPIDAKECPKITQDRPKMRPRPPKIARRRPKIGPSGSKKGPGSAKMTMFTQNIDFAKSMEKPKENQCFWLPQAPQT